MSFFNLKFKSDLYIWTLTRVLKKKILFYLYSIAGKNLQEEIYDSNKSDLYIAACVHNSIEIYKVQPIIDKVINIQ